VPVPLEAVLLLDDAVVVIEVPLELPVDVEVLAELEVLPELEIDVEVPDAVVLVDVAAELELLCVEPEVLAADVEFDTVVVLAEPLVVAPVDGGEVPVDVLALVPAPEVGPPDEVDVPCDPEHAAESSATISTVRCSVTTTPDLFAEGSRFNSATGEELGRRVGQSLMEDRPRYWSPLRCPRELRRRRPCSLGCSRRAQT
jgi:hypothetical protein